MRSNFDKQELVNAKKYKKLFDLCESMGEGVHGKLHICDSSDDSRFPEEDQAYRVYHADGYCFDVRKQANEVAEDEICLTCIKGFEYSFMEGIYEGFKDIDIDQAIKLF